MPSSFPAELVLRYVEEKQVYQFYNREKNHYHVCVYAKDEDFLFVFCTSQEWKIGELINRGIIAESTIVWIDDSNNVDSKKKTYADCNKVDRFTKAQLISKISNESFEYRGKIADNVFNDIILGALQSKQVPREYKAILKRFLDDE